MWVELPAEPPDLEAVDALAMRMGLEARRAVAGEARGGQCHPEAQERWRPAAVGRDGVALGGGPRLALPGL